MWFLYALTAVLFWAMVIYAPRELLTAQSVQVKLASFAVMFIGLAFLVLS